ncbi:hypothetical protein [Microbacterium arborescens]|uniref:hypothetical protein n=1 Tax=Microbacterium arborescens TaxID=33883 RepID=UPI00259FE247|nr:hypothetical protein [Microbacterium arborescens]WJM15774.1 hypothetical protein QUC20_00240 [Microbacterium arborescens]
MSEGGEQIRYIPLRPAGEYCAAAQRRAFVLSELSVTGLVIICELDEPLVGGKRPTMSMKITQYLRMSDDSMVRLDMDRGVSSFTHGRVRPVSWKRAAQDVIDEVLDLVRADGADGESFPWEDYAQAARVRGIEVDPEELKGLPRTVLISDELATIFEF